jgi:hypothetical protein
LLVPLALVRGDDPRPDEEKSDENLQAMTTRAKLLRAEFADESDPQPLSLVEKPLLRYDAPAGIEVDGTLWLWTRDEKPVATVCVFLGRPPAARWTYELSSLSNRPLRVTGRPGWRWQPKEQERNWLDLTGDVPDTPVARLSQMRSLAREFDGSEKVEGESAPLRLMPQPVYRYAHADSGVIDGALFALAYGTNPEVLIQIEARRNDAGNDRWLASFGRVGGGETTVRHGEKIMWHVEEIRWFAHDPQTPYYSAWGADPVTE